MKIPDEVRRAVAFIGYQNKANGQFVPIGTSFFLGRDPIDDSKTSPRIYTVTARHVVEGLRSKGATQLVMRLNNKADGSSFSNFSIDLDNWFVHPTDGSIDVAIFERGISEEEDHLAIAFSMCATSDEIANHEVVVGDEVFISGLFTQHFGNEKNIPIVRVGNLSAMDEEKVSTISFGSIDAYLIECRSTGGLSGSPVFLNLGITRIIKGEFKQSSAPIVRLLGLMHGHYDIKDRGSEGQPSALNAGIGVVVPIEKVLEVVEQYEKVHPKKTK